ncbi:CPBP family intramembrane glutamic endopeptidase [Nocardiopsis flavescens]|uniref:CPBP family intramembrane glutamic endopeptidase n=1 Tax=Nocardiopsis flavescens TaxID=758803 RepID=UPI00365F8F07
MILLYVVVFSVPATNSVVLLLNGADVVLFNAPGGDDFWARALPAWTLRACVLATAFLGLLMVCRTTLLIPVREVFTPRHSTDAQAQSHRRGQQWRVFLAAFLTITALTPPGEVLGGYAADTPVDAAWTALLLAPTQLTGPLVEEPIAMGLLVLLLRAARRPLGEVCAIGALAKVGYHLYYGLPVLGLAVMAAILIWLYWRTGQLWPIVLAHISYNAVAFLLLVLP